MSELGHLVESFAVNKLLKQASWAMPAVTAGHFRTRDGSEVDLVLERDDGAILGIEMKATSTVRSDDAARSTARSRPSLSTAGGCEPTARIEAQNSARHHR